MNALFIGGSLDGLTMSNDVLEATIGACTHFPLNAIGIGKPGESYRRAVLKLGESSATLMIVSWVSDSEALMVVLGKFWERANG